VDINNSYITEVEDSEKEITEIINELKKLDSSQLSNVLGIVKEIRRGDGENLDTDK
jgi:hypothetical protein